MVGVTTKRAKDIITTNVNFTTKGPLGEPGRSSNMLEMDSPMSVEKDHRQTFQSMITIDEGGNR